MLDFNGLATRAQIEPKRRRSDPMSLEHANVVGKGEVVKEFLYGL
jgi:hypothetical protein